MELQDHSGSTYYVYHSEVPASVTQARQPTHLRVTASDPACAHPVAMPFNDAPRQRRQTWCVCRECCGPGGLQLELKGVRTNF